MITLIGTSTTTIGFGLCGIKDIHEVRRSMEKETILKLVKEAENEIIMIDEDIFEKIREDVRNLGKIFIKIPFRHKKEDEASDAVDEMVKDTLGISIKN